jgi:hypothetical protein
MDQPHLILILPQILNKIMVKIDNNQIKHLNVSQRFKWCHVDGAARDLSIFKLKSKAEIDFSTSQIEKTRQATQSLKRLMVAKHLAVLLTTENTMSKRDLITRPILNFSHSKLKIEFILFRRDNIMEKCGSSLHMVAIP